MEKREGTGPGGPQSVQRLEVWQEAIQLVASVYRLSALWPADERYGLTSQARRAAVSIPANLAEGVGRGTPKEIARFAGIARGSAFELHTLLSVSAKLELTDTAVLAPLLDDLDRLNKRLGNFIRYQEQRQ